MTAQLASTPDRGQQADPRETLMRELGDFISGRAGSGHFSPAADSMRAQPEALLAQHDVSGFRQVHLGTYLEQAGRLVCTGDTGLIESPNEKLIKELIRGTKALHIPGSVVVEVGESDSATYHVMQNVVIALAPGYDPYKQEVAKSGTLRITSLSVPTTYSPSHTPHFDIDVTSEGFNRKLEVHAHTRSGFSWSHEPKSFSATNSTHRLVIPGADQPITIHICSNPAPSRHIDPMTHIRVNNRGMGPNEWQALISAARLHDVPAHTNRSLAPPFQTALYCGEGVFRNAQSYPQDFWCGIARTDDHKSWIAYAPREQAMIVFCPALMEGQNRDLVIKLGAQPILDHDGSPIDGAYRIPTDSDPNAALRAMKTIVAIDRPLTTYEELHGRDADRLWQK